jgi:broad specificity phosphatase PhoE
VAVTLDERLRERGYGSHEGRPLTELVDAARQAGVSVKDYTPSGGETQDSVDERLSFFLGDLCRAVCKMNLQHAIPRKDGGLLEPTLPSPHWHVLLVSHGGALHALCEQLRQLHACELPHRHIATPNASISSFFLTLQDQSCHSARTLTAHNTKHLEHLSG